MTDQALDARHTIALRETTLGEWCARRGLPYMQIAAGRPGKVQLRSLPGITPGTVLKLEQPEVFCGLVEGAWVLPDCRFPFTTDGYLILRGFTLVDSTAFADLKPYLQGKGEDGQIAITIPGKAVPVEQACVFIGGLSNFGHFILESVLRLMALNSLPDAQLLPIAVFDDLPARYLEFLDLLGFTSERRIMVPRNALLRFSRVWFLSSPVSRAEVTSPARMSAPAVWALRTSTAYLSRPMGAPRPRFYLGRSNVTWRRVVNEAAVQALLARFSVMPLELSHLSAEEQISIVSNAEMLVTVVGAASQIVFFSAPDCATIELSPSQMPATYGPAAVAAIFDQPYARLVCRIATAEDSLAAGLPPNPSQQYYDQDIVVDLAGLETLLAAADKWCRRAEAGGLPA